MRHFHTYGPINTTIHYSAPRTALIERVITQLKGDSFEVGGQYFTVWGPRQTGKTSIIIKVLDKLREDPRFDVFMVNLEALKDIEDPGEVINILSHQIGEAMDLQCPEIMDSVNFQELFRKEILLKPLILILDEVDTLPEKAIHTLVAAFRSIYNVRQYEFDKTTKQKTYLLHAVALIGVRQDLGIENEKTSPFSVQRSLKIDNLTFAEVAEMFQCYQQESGQTFEPAVIERIYQETKGQPGITCRMGKSSPRESRTTQMTHPSPFYWLTLNASIIKP